MFFPRARSPARSIRFFGVLRAPAVVEDSADTTTAVQHATSVQKPPKAPGACLFY